MELWSLVQKSCVCTMLCAADKRHKTANARVLGIPMWAAAILAMLPPPP